MDQISLTHPQLASPCLTDSLPYGRISIPLFQKYSRNLWGRDCHHLLVSGHCLLLLRQVCPHSQQQPYGNGRQIQCHYYRSVPRPSQRTPATNQECSWNPWKPPHSQTQPQNLSSGWRRQGRERKTIGRPIFGDHSDLRRHCGVYELVLGARAFTGMYAESRRRECRMAKHSLLDAFVTNLLFLALLSYSRTQSRSLSYSRASMECLTPQRKPTEW